MSYKPAKTEKKCTGSRSFNIKTFLPTIEFILPEKPFSRNQETAILILAIVITKIRQWNI